MKKLFILAFMALAFNAWSQDDWSTFKTEDGKAQATLPGTPQLQSQTVPTPMGDVTMNMNMLDLSSSGGDNMMMGVITMIYPEAMRDSTNTSEKMAAFFDKSMNGAAANTGGTVKSSNDFEMNGHPGREFSIEIMGGMAVIKMKMVMVGTTSYALQVISKGDKEDNEEAKTFIDSFKLEDN